MVDSRYDSIDFLGIAKRATQSWRFIKNRHTPDAVIEKLIEQSKGCLSTDSEKAIEHAQAAVRMAETVWPKAVPGTKVRAMGFLMTAYRRAGDFLAAEKVEELADAIVDTGKILLATDEAIYFRHKALLIAAQGYPDIALFWIDQAMELLEDTEEKHHLGIVRFTRAEFLADTDRFDEAECELLQSLDEIDCEKEPRWAYAAFQNLAHDYVNRGRLTSARSAIKQARGLLASAGDNEADALRLDWIDARLQGALGESGRAENLFWTVRDGFHRQGRAYEVALVTLELALLMAESGSYRQVKRLAEESLTMFRALHLPQRQTAAFSVLRTAKNVEAIQSVQTWVKQHAKDWRVPAATGTQPAKS